MALFPDGRSYQSAQGQSIGDGIFRIPVPSYVKERFWSAKTGIFFRKSRRRSFTAPSQEGWNSELHKTALQGNPPHPSCLKFGYFLTRVTLGGAVRFLRKIGGATKSFFGNKEKKHYPLLPPTPLFASFLTVIYPSKKSKHFVIYFAETITRHGGGEWIRFLLPDSTEN